MITAKEFVKKIAVPLGDLGFKKRGKGAIFTCDIGNDYLGWIGMNDAKRNGLVEINQVIGIRNQKVQSIIARLAGRDDDSYTPATVSLSLGYLMPEKTYKPWYFDEVSEEQLHLMVEQIKTYAIPFMKSSTVSLDVFEKVVERHSPNIYKYYRMPAVLALNGKFEEAMFWVNKELENIKDDPNTAADEYRAFAENFKKEYGLS